MTKQLWVRGVWGVAVAVVSSALAIAQQNNPSQNQSNTQQPNNVQQTNPQQFNQREAQRGPMRTFRDEHRGVVGQNDIDHYLIKVLVQANKDEIEMGNLAQQRSNNPEVKQLATQLVQDHTRFLNTLESLKRTGHEAGQQVGNQPIQQRGTGFRGTTPNGIEQQQQTQQQQPALTPDQLRNQRLSDQQQNQVQAQPGQNNQTMAGRRAHQEHMGNMGEHGTAGHFAKIMEEVDRNLQQSMVRELSSKQGAQFDRCFLTGQLFGHMWVVDALKVFEQNASPQLRPILQEGLQTSEQHLNHLKSLLAKIDNEPTSQNANTGIQPQRGNRILR